jgi:predicted aldo/keto reductase-like oxidoreductase
MPCPFGVNIPKCFKEYNMDKISGNETPSVQYRFHLHDDRKAHNCVKCGKCITSCPQSINIPEQLSLVEKHFGD